MDSNGKPLAVGISKAAIARTKGEYVTSTPNPRAWWEEEFSENGFKQVAGSRTGGYNFTTAPDGTVYYRDDNNGGVLTILRPDGTTETVAGTNAAYLAVGPDGKVWFKSINHFSKLAYYDPATGDIAHVEGAQVSEDIKVAPDGKVWFRGYNGSYNLAYYNPVTGNTQYVVKDAMDITIAPDGKVWFRDWDNGSNLAYYDPVRGSVKDISGTFASNIAVAPDGKVWLQAYNQINSYDDLAYYDPRTRDVVCVMTGVEPSYTTVAPDGKVWYINRFGILKSYDPTTGYEASPGIFANGIHIDDAGNIWVADSKSDNVLTVYSPEKDQTRE